MASLTQWTWVWVSSTSWWWTGRPVGCNPWGCKESDMAEQLNWTSWGTVANSLVSWADCWRFGQSSNIMGFPGGTSGKESTCQWRRFWGWEDPLQEEMTTYSSILAWEIPWTEEPGKLQSMGSQRVRGSWACRHTNFMCGPAIVHLYIQFLSAKGKELSLETLMSSSVFCIWWGKTP